jgi:hypothetical protein
LETNHQLESRVQEICLPGSEGGAKLVLRPYPYHEKQTSAKTPRAMQQTGHPGLLAQATEPQVVL